MSEALSIDWELPAKAGFQRLIAKSAEATRVALSEAGDELLRLSGFEVPHKTGWLQGSGRVDVISDSEVWVGYHTAYAARLHEHPEYRFGEGRKGKYLSDPLMKNTQHLMAGIARSIHNQLGLLSYF